MRRNTLWFLIAVVVLAGVSTVLFVRYRQGELALQEARAREDATHRRYESAIDDIAAIQDSLNAITFGEDQNDLSSSGVDAERRLSPNRTDDALARVAELRSGIERTRERIVELESRLQGSGQKVAGLERIVNQMKANLARKEAMVAQLTSQVSTLNTQVGSLTATVVTQDSTLEARRRELGTIYYIVGDRKELLDNGAVVAKGGVLGIGKTLDTSGQVNEATFKPIDTDMETVIPIAASKVRVLSAQPVSSYRLEQVAGGYQLRILDPQEFRKVRHLVVLTS
jgi:uncharacterized coiled-coil protein SlyX